MNTTKAATGGSWSSPLTADRIASATISLIEPRSEQERIYWIEGRPMEQGRQVLVERLPDGSTRDLTLAPFSVRNRVHEYGGGSYTVHGHRIYFCNDADGGIYLIDNHQPPRRLLAEAGLRFSDLACSADGQLYCVCEDHRPNHSKTTDNAPVNTLIIVSTEKTDTFETIAAGDDFFASPTISPDGRRIAWISWSHPDMPWDRSRLWIAELSEHGMAIDHRILLDDGSSIFQPSWSPDNKLYFCSDRQNGWWNIHRWDGNTIENLCPFDAEFGLPQWQFGMSVYGFLSAGQILTSYSQNGVWQLGLLCTHTGELQQIKSDKTLISAMHAHDNTALMLASSGNELTGIYQYNHDTRTLNLIKASGSLELDQAMVSKAEQLDFPTANHSLVHAFFYAPSNSRYRLPENELPPLIVISHGGPTAATSSAYNAKIQYWTTRGFAVLDVNYRGSTGYGREYRQKLDGQWGVADVEDCIAGARALVAEKRADPDRLIIRGSSAGGFTTLCALTFHDTFKAGASLYGIGDLETLVTDTHKFEARYLDRLVGPYPETKDTYQSRSPIHHTDQLKCPVIFLQGLEDRVVPPQQAEAMVTVLKQKGVMVEYVTFEHEQHGFRSGEAIKRALESELAFYGRVFGFAPASNTK